MLTPLIAYDAGGNIISVMDHLVARVDGVVVGLYDFAAHEANGGKLRDFWDVNRAVGSGTWPEWLGDRTHEFRVQLDGKLIVRLVHPSGFVRHRDRIEAEILRRHQTETRKLGSRVLELVPLNVDLRDLVGGPGKPLRLDERGRTVDGQRDTEALPLHLR